jgi:hypothetical protein
MDGADIVVDVANAPSWEDQAVLEFSKRSAVTCWPLKRPPVFGITLRCRLSGPNGCPSGYFGPRLRESLIKASGIPYSICVRSSSNSSAPLPIRCRRRGTSCVASADPAVGVDDVVAALTDVVLAAPLNGTVEVAGPEAMPIDELVRRFLRATRDTRRVVPDVHALLRRRARRSITDPRPASAPGRDPFEDWLTRSMAEAGR